MFSRTLLFSALLGGSIAFTSCDVDGLAVNKDFSGATIELPVPASPQGGEVSIVKQDIETNFRQSLEDFDISTDRVKAVGVKSVVARIMDPSDEFTFENLTDLALTFESAELGDIMVASLPNASGTEATFVVEDADLKEFLLSDKFNAVLTGMSDIGVSQGVMAEVDVTYAISAGL